MAEHGDVAVGSSLKLCYLYSDFCTDYFLMSYVLPITKIQQTTSINRKQKCEDLIKCSEPSNNS